ncbi:MAG: hypothetical protein HY841_04970 [Bacteroidetes bacterium]|nr:hypothetical protein [Bacteroidota bacterium]
MSPKEKKELVGYLKKETDRLDRAISKAQSTGRFGRVANYEQMRDALASTLNKLITENKNPLLIIVALLLLLFPPAGGQITAPKQKPDKILSGKTFVIEPTEKWKPATAAPLMNELSFMDDQLHSNLINTPGKNDSLPSGFSSGSYTRMVDSSEAEVTILFAALSKKKNGETILWLGSVTGDTIQGTAHWSKRGKANKVFYFTGIKKYKGKSKGNAGNR